MEYKKASNNKDSGLRVVSIEEKPANLKSNYEIVGLYYYSAMVSEMVKNVKSSQRGDYERKGDVTILVHLNTATENTSI